MSFEWCCSFFFFFFLHHLLALTLCQLEMFSSFFVVMLNVLLTDVQLKDPHCINCLRKATIHSEHCVWQVAAIIFDYLKSHISCGLHYEIVNDLMLRLVCVWLLCDCGWCVTSDKSTMINGHEIDKLDVIDVCCTAVTKHKMSPKSTKPILWHTTITREMVSF